MAQSKRIGIIYNYNENWIGGSYYIQNLIRSFNYLPQRDQIKLYILTQDKSVFKELKASTQYSNLKFIAFPSRYNKWEVLVNKVSKKLFKRKIIVKKIKLDWVFPLYNIPNNLQHIKNLVFWIPDLQEKYLPSFFSKEEINNRHQCYENMMATNKPIVFSSQSALNDFNSFYPDSKNQKHVISFAVTHPDLASIDYDSVKVKYGIDGEYFFSPNQFWQHKNHIAIIEAVKILKERGNKIRIVFTGKEQDYRNTNYTTNLKQKVSEYGLENQISFLGFIDRMDQLVLMKNSLAVIQPSFFEGWSTVVEDAKALSQTLIVSYIAVHKEQLNDKAYFFEPNDYNDLASKIDEVLENPSNILRYDLDYRKDIAKFALNFKQLIDRTQH